MRAIKRKMKKKFSKNADEIKIQKKCFVLWTERKIATKLMYKLRSNEKK